MQRDQLRKQDIRERFDRLSSHRARWQEKAGYYYEDQLRYLRFLVSEGLSVLEIGCGLGDQLAALKPKRGLGIDFSAAMVKEAAQRHPEMVELIL
jgi:ubiquinone/menaquinone biosynthesis C-methylase UbiE